MSTQPEAKESPQKSTSEEATPNVVVKAARPQADAIAPGQVIDQVVNVPQQSTPVAPPSAPQQPDLEEKAEEATRPRGNSRMNFLVMVLVLLTFVLSSQALTTSKSVINTGHTVLQDSKNLTKRVTDLQTENTNLKQQLKEAQKKVKGFQTTVREQAQRLNKILELGDQIKAKLKKFDFVIDIGLEEIEAPGHPQADDKGNVVILEIKVDKAEVKNRPVVQVLLVDNDK